MIQAIDFYHLAYNYKTMSSRTPIYSLTLIIAGSPLGWFGVHHFYVGNEKRAALYFIFCWTLVPLILSLIDAMVLIKRGREQFIEKHGTDDDLEQYYEMKLRQQRGYVPRTSEEENKESDKKEDENDEVASDMLRDDIDYSNYYGEWK